MTANILQDYLPTDASPISPLLEKEAFPLFFTSPVIPSRAPASSRLPVPVSESTSEAGPGLDSDRAPPPAALLHRSLTIQPQEIISGNGIYLTLSSGKTIIDACGGAAVACIGHGNEEVLLAVMKQMRKVSYVHTLTYTTDSAEELAHVLLDGNPYGLEKAFFVSSGSEAMDAALKLARQYHYELALPSGNTQRTHYISRLQSYHGTTLGAMAVSSNLPRKKPYASLQLPVVSFVAPAYEYQYRSAAETTTAQYVDRLLAELEAEIHRIGSDRVIAFVAEPVVGATSACTPAPPGYFHGVRQICDRYGILLILDEVMCGAGRAGTFFAFEQEADGCVPDILTMGKGLGGGYVPIAAVLASKKVVDVLRQGSGGFNHGQTYQAHPVSCAAALAVQRIIRRDGLVAHCAAMGRVLEELLRAGLGPLKYVGDVRGRGLFWGVEFVQEREGKRSFTTAVRFGARVQSVAADMGVVVYPGNGTVDGSRGDHVIVAPPYTVTKEDLRVIVDVLKKAYRVVEMEVDETGLSNNIGKKENN